MFIPSLCSDDDDDTASHGADNDNNAMTPPGDVRDVPVERPLPRRGVHGEEVGLPHPEVIQLHSQQVSTDRFVRNEMNEVLI